MEGGKPQCEWMLKMTNDIRKQRGKQARTTVQQEEREWLNKKKTHEG